MCEQRGSHCRTYVYGEDAFVPLARIDSVAGSDGASLAEVCHLHTDHLGTPRELTDPDGQVVWAAQYRAWGNVLKVAEQDVSVSAPDAAEPAFIDDIQPLRFQGQYFDNETGLHYNRFRYYDPDVGGFASSDPIGLAGGLNSFSYALNPVDWIDPLGLAPCKTGGASDVSTPASWGLSISDTKKILASSQQPYNGSTLVGHALSKHSGRPATFSNPTVSRAQVWGKIRGQMSTWNEQGMSHLREIITAPGEFTTVVDGNLTFLEKRLADSRGVRLNQDKTFNGFVD